MLSPKRLERDAKLTREIAHTQIRDVLREVVRTTMMQKGGGDFHPTCHRLVDSREIVVHVLEKRSEFPARLRQRSSMVGWRHAQYNEVRNQEDVMAHTPNLETFAGT